MPITEVINIVIAIIAGIFTVINAVYTSRQREIERQFRAMWARIDEKGIRLNALEKQLDILQGEHNVLACKEAKHDKRK